MEDRLESLLDDFYGGDDENDAELEARKQDVDSVDFDAQTFLAEVLRNDPLPTLLRRDEVLSKEIGSLDADMRVLVYENYSKFILATDSIKKVRLELKKAQGTLRALSLDIDSMIDMVESTDSKLDATRTEVCEASQKLDLAKKLHDVLTLPERIRSSASKAHSVKLWTGFKSSIKNEVPPCLKRAHDDAKSAIEDVETSLLSSLEKSDRGADFKEICVLLVELGNDPKRIVDAYINMASKDLQFDEECELQRFVEVVAPSMALKASKHLKDFHTSFVDERSEVNSAFESKIASEEESEEAKRVRREVRSQIMKEASERLKQMLVLNLSNALRDRFVLEPSRLGDAEDFAKALSGARLLLKNFTNDFEGADRAAELVERAMRRQIDAAFELLCIETSRAFAEDFGVLTLHSKMESLVDSTLLDLKKLVMSAQSLLADLTSLFKDSVDARLHDWVLWLAGFYEQSADEFHVMNDSRNLSSTTRYASSSPLVGRVGKSPYFVMSLCLRTIKWTSSKARELRIVDADALEKRLRRSIEFLLERAVDEAVLGLKYEVSFEAVVDVHETFVEFVNELKRVSRSLDEAGCPAGGGGVASLTGSVENTSVASSTGVYKRKRRFSAANAPPPPTLEAVETARSSPVYVRVEFTKESAIKAMTRRFLKKVVETVRASHKTLNRAAYRQLELDVAFLKLMMPECLDDDSSHSDLTLSLMETAKFKCADPCPASAEQVLALAESMKSRMA